MKQTRRMFLKGSVAGSMIAVAAGAGLLSPRSVLAAWPKAAFDAKSVEDALKAIAGADAATESADVKVKAPDIAENGSVVPITVDAKMPGVENISVLVVENARPLCVNSEMTDGVAGYVSTRVKMGKTSYVIGVVKAGGKVYTARKEVKVTLGGCGG
jgi:sulfur-oxidizing protein SoxY